MSSKNTLNFTSFLHRHKLLFGIFYFPFILIKNEEKSLTGTIRVRCTRCGCKTQTKQMAPILIKPRPVSVTCRCNAQAQNDKAAHVPVTRGFSRATRAKKSITNTSTIESLLNTVFPSFLR